MRRFFPLLCLAIAVLCFMSAAPLLGDVHGMLKAVLPMVTSYEGFVAIVSAMYILMTSLLMFLAGVFITMAFTVRLENKKPNE
jgi:hypothetical protein